MSGSAVIPESGSAFIAENPLRQGARRAMQTLVSTPSPGPFHGTLVPMDATEDDFPDFGRPDTWRSVTAVDRPDANIGRPAWHERAKRMPEAISRRL
ncbi:hypothetical protein AwMethylo_30880 [Methylobacterium sp.]|nr:hypothetical protein AwMethylo_30880 [Methylobacterium sp.]